MECFKVPCIIDRVFCINNYTTYLSFTDPNWLSCPGPRQRAEISDSETWHSNAPRWLRCLEYVSSAPHRPKHPEQSSSSSSSKALAEPHSSTALPPCCKPYANSHHGTIIIVEKCHPHHSLRFIREVLCDRMVVRPAVFFIFLVSWALHAPCFAGAGGQHVTIPVSNDN